VEHVHGQPEFVVTAAFPSTAPIVTRRLLLQTARKKKPKRASH
jgi:hypothetical protein